MELTLAMAAGKGTVLPSLAVLFLLEKEDGPLTVTMVALTEWYPGSGLGRMGKAVAL